MSRVCRTLLNLCHRLNGDVAYERYLAHHRQAHPGEPPKDRRAFYDWQVERRYRSVNRCC